VSALKIQSHAAILAARHLKVSLSGVFVPDRISFKHHLAGAHMDHADALPCRVGQAFNRAATANPRSL